MDLQSEEALFRSIIATKQGARLRESGKMSCTRTRKLALSTLSSIGLDKSRYGVQGELQQQQLLGSLIEHMDGGNPREPRIIN